MDVSELNIQESIIMFMTPHEEQVELSDIVSHQNLESEDSTTTNLSIDDTFMSWEDVDGIMEAYGKRHGFTIIKK
ncbi:unnamed protein product [Rhizophagus irregularis]|nr:unnamed protein product [Rhizophagus irregularis]CAB4431107.1 unnamed protein product [Rhizophagus irregularis]